MENVHLEASDNIKVHFREIGFEDRRWGPLAVMKFAVKLVNMTTPFVWSLS